MDMTFVKAKYPVASLKRTALQIIFAMQAQNPVLWVIYDM